jgi:hypothetical protein
MLAGALRRALLQPDRLAELDLRLRVALRRAQHRAEQGALVAHLGALGTGPAQGRLQHLAAQGDSVVDPAAVFEHEGEVDWTLASLG